MNLQERVISDLKEALLSRDNTKVSVLRMLKSEFKYAEIAQGKELDEQNTIQVIRRELKKRLDAAESYRTANQEGRAQQEENEAKILTAYLPAQADIKEVESYIRDVIKGLDNPGPKNRGEVIKSALSRFSGQTDGKTVSDIVNRLLQ